MCKNLWPAQDAAPRAGERLTRVSDWLLALLSPERAGPRCVSILVFEICTALLQTLLSGNPSCNSDTEVTSHFLLSCSKNFPWEHRGSHNESAAVGLRHPQRQDKVQKIKGLDVHAGSSVLLSKAITVGWR